MACSLAAAVVVRGVGVGLKALLLGSWSGRLATVYALVAIATVVLRWLSWWSGLISVVCFNAFVMAIIFARVAVDDPGFRGRLDSLAASATALFTIFLMGYYLILAQLGIVAPSPYDPRLALAGPLSVLAFFIPPIAINLVALAMLIKRLCFADGGFKRGSRCVSWIILGPYAVMFLAPLGVAIIIYYPDNLLFTRISIFSTIAMVSILLFINYRYGADRGEGLCGAS